MNVDDMLDALEDVDDLDELRRLRKGVEARAEVIRRAQYQRMVTDRWAKLERCKPGTVLYIGGRGTIRIGSIVQTGDSVKVVWIDREREQLCVRLHRVNGKLRKDRGEFVLDARGCERHKLSRKKPGHGTSDLNRTMARNLGKVFE